MTSISQQFHDTRDWEAWIVQDATPLLLRGGVPRRWRIMKRRADGYVFGGANIFRTFEDARSYVVAQVNKQARESIGLRRRLRSANGWRPGLPPSGIGW